MKTVIIDEKVAKTIIHEDQHMYFNVPHAIKEINVSLDDGRNISLQHLYASICAGKNGGER